MPTVKLSPIFNGESQFDTNGAFLNGGKLYWYLAGTSTPATTYTDNSGTTPHTNPIILGETGQPPAPIWLADGVSYKAILKTSTDVPIGITYDNITGVNQSTTSPNFAEWQALSGALTYISGTSFSIAGDVTSTLLPGRRVKVTVSAGTVYGTVFSAVFAVSTTVVLVLDSGALDSGISAVYYGILAPTNSSIPKTYTDGWGGTAGGTADALTITVTPAISAYAAGQTFKFIGAASNATTAPTINVDGLGAKTIKVRSAAGGKSAIAIGSIAAGMEIGVVYDGTDFILESGGGAAGSQTFTASGTFTVPICSYVKVIAIGPGGGGGSGRRGAAASLRYGGAGGGGGAVIERIYSVSQIGGIGAAITCTVPAGGIGGNSVTTNDTDGIAAAAAAGATTFGSFITARQGSPGAGGSAVASTGGAGASVTDVTTGTLAGGAAGVANTAGTSAEFGGGGGGGSSAGAASVGGSSFYSNGAGGGGGAITAGDTENAGQAGGSPNQFTNGGGGAGGAIATAGTAGSQNSTSFTSSGGGGGGASKTVAAGAGGNGGVGAGGGGGGASLNGFASGKGGDGGRGEIRIFWW